MPDPREITLPTDPAAALAAVARVAAAGRPDRARPRVSKQAAHKRLSDVADDSFT